MVSAAEYIRRKLREDSILTRALTFDPTKNTQNYDLVLVGHSLGAGTAAILAILLKQEHPNLSCFAYSPPGGLLRYVGEGGGGEGVMDSGGNGSGWSSWVVIKHTHTHTHIIPHHTPLSPPSPPHSMPAVEYTRSFITSVVVGKDVVPRIGLHQMESMRADLINAIQRSKDPKVTTVALLCPLHLFNQ